MEFAALPPLIIICQLLSVPFFPKPTVSFWVEGSTVIAVVLELNPMKALNELDGTKAGENRQKKNHPPPPVSDVPRQTVAWGVRTPTDAPEGMPFAVAYLPLLVWSLRLVTAKAGFDSVPVAVHNVPKAGGTVVVAVGTHKVMLAPNNAGCRALSWPVGPMNSGIILPALLLV
jgi:hypothetical protein